MKAPTFLASILLFSVCVPSAVQAGIVLGLIPTPASTAGVPSSTRSGPGSWQLYAIEDATNNDLGIGTYNITMTGTTALNHRSPNGIAIDMNGDVQNWGFSLLRTGTNVNPITAAEPLPGTSPFVITGFGRTAGSASSQILAADPAATSITATSGATWGTYNDPILTNTSLLASAGALKSLAAVSAGRKWVFIAEGLAADPFSTTAASGAFTVLSNTSGAQIASTFSGFERLVILPEPCTASLFALSLLAAILRRTRPCLRTTNTPPIFGV